jgi:hypothetical protein
MKLILNKRFHGRQVVLASHTCCAVSVGQGGAR